EDNEIVSIYVHGRVAPQTVAWGIYTEINYHIFGSGEIRVEVKGNFEGDVPRTIPKIGMHMTIPRRLEKVSWYGLGPGEAYIYCWSSNLYWVSSKHIKDLFTHYIHPQENGNRRNVRLITVSGVNGNGIKLKNDQELDFSTSIYSREQIDKANHLYELQEEDRIHLNIVYKQHGLGSASCGPDVLRKY